MERKKNLLPEVVIFHKRSDQLTLPIHNIHGKEETSAVTVKLRSNSLHK
jgi:hypothetical protein